MNIKEIMRHIKRTIVASVVAALLAACGGGGNASSPAVTSSPAPVPMTPTAPIVNPANLQTTVPTLTYGASSEEFAYVTALNNFRAQVGLGLLAQSSLLDKSAQNHLQYVLKNDVNTGGTVVMSGVDPATGRQMFHIESAGKPLFTGTQELDRAKSVGYTGAYVGEEGMFAGGKGANAALSSVTSTVYHRAGLMYQGLRDVGLAVGVDASQTFVLEMGYITPQANAGDFLGIYPFDNQTDVGLHAGVELPNPFPDLSTMNSDFPTKTGYPASVVAKEGATLEVVSFTMSEAGATAPLDSRIMTQATDPNRLLASNLAFLVAKATLKPNTAYSVAFSGRVNNVVVNKNWKFTTGN